MNLDNNTRVFKKKLERKNRRRKVILVSFLAAILVLGTIQIPKLLGVFSSFTSEKFTTQSDEKHFISILVLGLDNDNGKDVESGHTDSITYIAANTETKKAYALPIYRDAKVPVACAQGTEENINRIYQQFGIECLATTVHDFLGLPVDHYAMVTMNGFIEIIDALGTLTMTPTDTFCSKYGVSKKVSHCFDEGVPTEMNADMAMAYLRYRGNSNGEGRADRQVQLLQALKNKCMDSIFTCYNEASPYFSGAFKTNVPIQKLMDVADIFGSNFELENLSVIKGENSEDERGWTQIVDHEDKQHKTDIIRRELEVQ